MSETIEANEPETFPLSIITIAGMTMANNRYYEVAAEAYRAARNRGHDAACAAAKRAVAQRQSEIFGAAMDRSLAQASGVVRRRAFGDIDNHIAAHEFWSAVSAHVASASAYASVIGARVPAAFRDMVFKAHADMRAA